MPSSTDDVCPPYGAEGAEARPGEQLRFTKDETTTICKRLLAGVAALQALSVSLLIAINVGGSRGPNSSVLAEDSFILTWSRFYMIESPEKTMNLLYTFYFYLNALCVRNANGASCLYRKIGHSFDDKLIDLELHSHFNETYQANVSDGAFSFRHGDGIRRKGITFIPFVLLITGLVISLLSWVFIAMSERAQQPGLQKALRISSVGAQMVPGVLFWATAILLRADAEDAYKTMEKAGVENEGTGWGFFAAVFCAAVAQILAATIQWTWAYLRPSLDKDGQGNDVIDVLRMNNNHLPAYSRGESRGFYLTPLPLGHPEY
ncbi:hypothetical protein PG996_001762 [Apiospora saccharicola]|uniref:Uncharacterized protein n=1 Tax=Apiospora saccharicola TaxID=335842 RepID=A0ABR1WHI7_9PEZI